ncbi:UNVERIFIED_CONTAM: hypothetical protein K2H54_026935 [Gekko kuhli]
MGSRRVGLDRATEQQQQQQIDRDSQSGARDALYSGATMRGLCNTERGLRETAGVSNGSGTGRRQRFLGLHKTSLRDSPPRGVARRWSNAFCILKLAQGEGTWDTPDCICAVQK